MPAPGFLSPPSGLNPSLGAASGFASGAASSYAAGLQFATALRAANAANQQNLYKQQQQGMKEKFDRWVQMTGGKGKEFTPYSEDTAEQVKPTVDANGMAVGGAFAQRKTQPNIDPSRISPPDETGQRWVAPLPTPDAGATPQQTYTDTAAALEKGAQPVTHEDTSRQMSTIAPQVSQGGGMFAPVPDQSRVVTPPGGKPMYFPTGDEQAATKLQQDKRAAAVKDDDKNYTLPDSISSKWEEKSGLPPGTLKGLSVPRAEIRSLITGLADKTEKNPLPHIVNSSNDAGDETVTAFDAQTGEKKWSSVQKGVGKKRVDMAAPMTPMGGGMAGQKTGDEYLATLPAGDSAILKGMSEGRIPPPTATSRSPRAQQLLQGLMQFDPGFTTQRAQVRRAFTTGTDGKNIGALNTAIVHLGRLGDTAEALNNGTFTPGNELFNYVKDKFGSAATTNFGLLKDAVAGEMAASLKGNATDVEIEKMGKSIRASNSPEQMHQVVSEGMAILKDKAGTYDERYHAVMPDDAWSPILPSAKAQLQKHGKGAAAGGSAGQGGYITNRVYGGKTYLGGDPNNPASWK